MKEIFLVMIFNKPYDLKLEGEHPLHHNMDQKELKRVFGTTVLSEGIIV
jgi:23S rRNA G2445 N2-methylase RlmL